MHDRDEITRLLDRLTEPDGSAARKLLPLVYDDLRALADHYFDAQRADHTLQPTALVHEAYLRLAGDRGGKWSGRDHFIAVAALAMRQILVDHARRKHADKRGGGRGRVALDDALSPALGREIDLVALDRALRRLGELDARKAQVVTMRYFGGLSGDAIAHVLGVSRSTVVDDWSVARAWLAKELGGSAPP